MEQQTNQNLSNSSPQNSFPLIPVIVSIVLTAVIVGGSIYWWSIQKQTELKNEVVSLQNQIDQLNKTVSPNQITSDNNQTDKLTNELVETKFKLAIRDFWNVREVFRNPQNKNQFYYISPDSSGTHICVYDLAKDKIYQQNGYFNIPEGNTLLYSQKLAQYQEFRGVGFSGNKFIFAETSTDNSPGPCFSPWFYSNLQYIDLGVSNPIKKSFTLPDDLRRTEEQKVSECQKTL
jgi:hypothetical protein